MNYVLLLLITLNYLTTSTAASSKKLTSVSFPPAPALPLPVQEPPLPTLTTTPHKNALYHAPIVTQAPPLTLQAPDTVTPSATKNTSTTGIAHLLTDPTVSLATKIIALQTSHTTLTGESQKITPHNKFASPTALSAATQAGIFSFTQQHKKATANAHTFTDTATEQAYNAFINAIEQNPHFITLFRRIHILALHELYMHLTGILITLNMTYFTDTKTALTIEKQYGLNKKTIIVSQLVSVIQAQLTQALQALFPGIPESYAISSGIKSLEHDHVSNPLALMLDLEKSILALLNMTGFSSSQITSLVNALTDAHNQKLFTDNNINTQDLTDALSIISTYGINFIKPILQKQNVAQAVQQALSLLVATYTHNQISTHYQTLLQALTQQNATSLSAQDMHVFITTLSSCTYGVPLNQALQQAQELYKVLSTDKNGSLSLAQKNSLRTLLSYILQNYEHQTATMLSSIIAQLGKLQPQHQTLSPSQKVALQKIASALLQKNNPLALDALTQTQRSLLAYALQVFAYTNTAFSQNKSLLLDLETQLQKGPLAWAELTTTQVAILKKVLSLCAAYTFEPLQAAAVSNTFTQEQQNHLVVLCDQIQSNAFTGFSTLSTQDQLLLLKMYQNVATVVETRFEEHTRIASPIASLFKDNTVLKQALFQSVSTDQYLALNTLYQQLQSGSFTVSNKTATSEQQTDGPSATEITLYQALLQLIQPTDSPPYNYVYFLQQLQKEQQNNTALQSFIATLTSQEQALYTAILNQTKTENFSFAQLSTTQKSACVNLFTYLLKAHTATPAQAATSLQLLSSSQESDIQTIAYVFNTTQQAAQDKALFLSVLQKYLTFFNLYTASLENYDTHNYSGLSTFQKNAQTIAQQVASTGAQDTNPPLFFYDQKTLHTLQLLPTLAQSIENTEIVPYPTFATELALANQATDPLDGKVYSNQATIGSGITAFSYNKFFFYNIPTEPDTITTTTFLYTNDTSNDPQPPAELTGTAAQNIPWITKTTIGDTTTTGTSTTIYRPNNVPNNTSGLYMNIPTFKQNPLNPGQALIRLYEQPLYAQPTWLNHSGTQNTASQSSGITPGVITVLRGCLGDFKALLDLDIFDPCLTMVFQSALGLPITTQKQCAYYLTVKQAEINRMQTTHTVSAQQVQATFGRTTVGIPTTGANT